MLAPPDPIDPFPWYREMRDTRPVTVDDGMANVFRYADVRAAITSPDTFSSRMEGLGDHPLASSLAFTDSPVHDRLRDLVREPFSPRLLSALGPRIARVTADILDEAERAGRLDVAVDLGRLPTRVIMELLGIPEADQERYARWADEFMAGGYREAGNPEGMIDYFRGLLAERRSSPAEDLLSALMAGEAEGRISQAEVLGFCVLLLIAGNETTAHLVTNAVWTLTEEPEALRRLREDPALVGRVVEEVLRYRSPSIMLFRTALADTRLGEVDIRGGQLVRLWLGSANRDERQFPDPDVFDIDRRSNSHVAFGTGVHACLGASLARLEARIVLEALLARFDSLERLDAPREPVGEVVFSLRHLPVAVVPRSRLAV
jgi:cytochrome P450